MDDSAVIWTLGGVIGLVLLCLAAIVIVDVALWYTTCPHTTTTCDCNSDYPVQCNYQCYHASKCTCDDLKDLQSTRDNVQNWIKKNSAGKGTPKAQTTGSSSGDIPGVSGDAGTGDNTQSGDAGTGTPANTGTGNTGGTTNWVQGKKVAGLTDAGEFWIDKEYQQQHCQSLADALYAHEMVHKGDDTCRNPASFALQVIQSIFNKDFRMEQLDRSESSAYSTQLAFLNDKIAALKATCLYEYKCSYSGAVFKNVQDCIAACPCSLAHPCAMVKPHCLEINSETQETTGMRY